MSNRSLIEQAKQAEQRGSLDEAIKLFAKAGEVEEAARLLVAGGDYPRAGRLLFRAVGLPIERMAEADPEQRKLAIKAAICLAKAGETSNAVALFVAAGDVQRAIDALTRAGDNEGAAKLKARHQPSKETRVGGSFGQPVTTSYAQARRLEDQGDREAALTQYIQAKSFQDAGRVARHLGKLEKAGELFEESLSFYEAAVCYHDARDTRRCFGALVRVSKEHPRYRAACVKAIEIGAQLGEVSFELDQLVSRFISAGPENAQEIDAFYILGRLYEKIGFPDNARECYRKIVDKQPGHLASARLRELEAETRGSTMVYERIMREDVAFRGDAPRIAHDPPSSTFAVLPELTELPELPGARKPVPAPAVQALQRAAQEVTEAPPPPRARVQAPAAVAGPFELVEGALVAERYLLEHKLGEGGTAVVFRAADLELEEEVAIKIFSNTLDDPDMVRRFKQELSVTRKLSHPNVVRLHDIGMDRGHRFLTMEVLKGHDLATRLASGPMPLPVALDLLLQASSGLALAHSHGVIHRDIKPENFFITSQGVLKVMDFGLAKKATAQKRTQAGFIAGTPPYMSPEQINGFADVTALADIYSLGIVAYEMCTGVLPFQHEELMPLLVMHMTEKPASPIGYNANIPRELSALILKLLEKEPANRVQSMSELGQQLAALRKLVK